MRNLIRRLSRAILAAAVVLALLGLLAYRLAIGSTGPHMISIAGLLLVPVLVVLVLLIRRRP